MEMYCGNNRLNKRLRNYRAYLGTPYQCFRRGIGIGRELPRDDAFLDDYHPIYPVRIYCGKKSILPLGYDRIGSLYDCHRKGIAVGKKITAEDGMFMPIQNKRRKSPLKRKKKKSPIRRKKSRPRVRSR